MVCGCALAGVAVLVVQLVVFHLAAVGDRAALGWLWLLTFVLLPVVGHVGGRWAPDRPGADAAATVAAQLGLLLSMRLRAVLAVDGYALRVAVEQAVLIGLVVLAARAGARRSRLLGVDRPDLDRDPVAPAPPA